ncbi:MAG: class I SAM-dependent methyltransferase [bacterium]
MSRPRFETSVVAKNARKRSPYWGEHVARYLFALPYVANHCTLDIACGDGYGLPLIQKSARGVVGVDISFQAAQNARSELGKGPGQVVVADGRRLPFADHSFEAVTSFETLEHLEDRTQFLSELARVLTPKGICILSTPNANYTLPVNGKPKNPYHVHEYTPEDLETELSGYFAKTTMLGESLDRRFVIPPFWDEQERLSKQSGMRKQILFWRVLNKVPSATVRDHVSRTVWGHPFLPSEDDYQFSESTVDNAPVLVAICHKAAAA